MGVTLQYEARRDAAGWTVFDRWTGRTVVLGARPQSGLPQAVADELAERLNRRRLDGVRTILQ